MNHWLIYISGPAKDNFTIARQQGIWGAKKLNNFIDADTSTRIQDGDQVYFVMDLDQQSGGRMKPEVFAGIVNGIGRILVGRISTPIYEDDAVVWPDDSYPHRFRFETVADLTLAEGSIPLSFEALVQLGRAYLKSGRGYIITPGDLQSPLTNLPLDEKVGAGIEDTEAVPSLATSRSFDATPIDVVSDTNYEPQFFFHPVGRANARRDFPRTVYDKVPLDRILSTVLGDVYEDLEPRLRKAFPSGDCNVWGIPQGGEPHFKHLRRGDVVLLLESTSVKSDAAAIGTVKVISREPLIELSSELWKSENYPLVLFFNARRIQLKWSDFKEIVGYKPKYRTSYFLRLNEEKLQAVGGAHALARKLQSNLTDQSLREEIQVRDSEAEITEKDVKAIRRQAEQIKTRTHTELPKLKESKPMTTQTTTSPWRDPAFSALVKKAYGYRCAMSGLELEDVKGRSEVQAAHIYPKRLQGADDIRNGICLSRLYHWAFDAGWLSLTDDHHIIVHTNLPHRNSYAFLRELQEKKIALPTDEAEWPDPLYIREHRNIHQF